MYFKRLEMHGFKSFAEPVTIEFNEGVTCIVGPNGSGKSNISDAIRWVLGEQSGKMLRAGKMDEVIFAGTANRKSRGMAEVTLVIDNSKGILPIDYNEVAITRRMFRSGESEYLINNNQCRLKDIRELIMDTGIGVDGYSIIGQGKIADMVSDKPENRREIFEEAAGVVLYKSKKNESEKKLSSANNNLDRVDDIIGEIEGRIDGLRDNSVRAKEYIQLRDKNKELEINITLKNIDAFDSRNQVIKEDTLELENNLKNILDEKNIIDEEVLTGREKSDNLERLGNDARDKLLISVENLNKLTNKGQLDTERLSTIDKDNNRIIEEIRVLNEKLFKEQKNAEELESQKSKTNANLKQAATQLEEKILAFNDVTSQSFEFAKLIDDGKDSLFKLHSNLVSKKSETISIESYKETLNKRKNQLINELKDIENSKKNTFESCKKSEKVKNETAEQFKCIKISTEENRKHYNELVQKAKKYSLKAEDLKLKGSQLTSRKKTIEEMENNYEGYNSAVKFVMKSALNGVDGVVAELMEVPSGLEVAIETALGGGLQNIICDNDNNAKSAVNSLKQNKAGRLTFLPRTSIKGYKANIDKKITEDSGYRGLAVDCIKFEKKYINIYEYLLGRVAVVDNMDSAIKLSKLAGNGVRFVTLEGEIINASGAITGGKYKNASANLLERKSEISKLEAEIEILIADYNTTNEKFKETNIELESLEVEIAEKEQKSKNLEIMIASLDNGVSSFNKEINDLEINNSKYSNELIAIEKDFKSANDMIKKLNVDADNIEEKIKYTDVAVTNAMAQHEDYKSLLDSASEEITKTRIAKNEWDNKIESLNQLLARVNETILDFEVQVSTKKTELESLEFEKNNILFGSTDVEQTVSKMISEKTELEEYISELTEEKNSLNEKLAILSKEQFAINENLGAMQNQKYQLDIKFTKNETQLDTFKEKLWEEFEISYIQAIEFRKKDFFMSSAIKENKEIKNRIRELGEVNIGSIKEYESVNERYEFLTSQRSDILEAIDELKSIISDMDITITTKFKENFDKVVINFEAIFKELFGGGTAKLSLENENDPLYSGINIEVQPPGKKLQNISLFSGGELTMIGIALMFSVLRTKPTPFCILDEVEAALDDTNIDRFANYLKKFDGIQFALITHQKATMEHADVLYGVTMPEQGISKVLSLDLNDDFELE